MVHVYMGGARCFQSRLRSLYYLWLNNKRSRSECCDSWVRGKFSERSPGPSQNHVSSIFGGPELEVARDCSSRSQSLATVQYEYLPARASS